MIILSESANNGVNQNHFRFFEKMEVEIMVPNELIPAIIRNEFEELNIDTNEMQKIQELVGFVPREAIFICRSEGETIDKKISNYLEKRAETEDIKQIHSKFNKKSKSAFLNYIGLFFTWTKIFLFISRQVR